MSVLDINILCIIFTIKFISLIIYPLSRFNLQPFIDSRKELIKHGHLE